MAGNNSRFTMMPTDRDINPTGLRRLRRAFGALFRPRSGPSESRSGEALKETAPAEMSNVQNSSVCF